MKPKYFIGLALMLIVGLLTWGNIVDARVRKFEFNGIVQAVKYDDNKSTPTVIVNNIEYYLSTNTNFNRQIEKGDSISKQKGVMIFLLFKKGSNKKIVFSD
jgi:hypothetical protein